MCTFYQQVNLSPALGADSDVDAAVKKPMLHDMFDLLGLPVSHTGLSMFTSWLPQQEDSTSDSEDYGSMTKQSYSSPCTPL
jgi:tubulin polyglutamylase TTLL2